MSDIKTDNFWLMKGDCLQRMKEIQDGSVDLILTDPPYNISKKNGFKTMGRAGIDFGEWDKDFNITSWMDDIPRLLNKHGSVIIFNDWKNIGEIARYGESLGLVTKDMIRWEKSNPMPRNKNRRYVTDYEVCVWLTMPKAKWTFNATSDTYHRPLYKGGLTPSSEKTGHTTQKPVYLMEKMIATHTDEGDVVVDMFMGSGTTGVACRNTGRKFIGIEKDDKYFEIAKARIVGGVK